jgi:hypothetical protein
MEEVEKHIIEEMKEKIRKRRMGKKTIIMKEKRKCFLDALDLT